MRSLFAFGSALALTLATPAAFAQEEARQLYAVKLAVEDYQRSAGFYEALGMKLGTRHNEWEWQLDWPKPGQGSAIIMVRGDAERYRVTRGGSTLVIRVPDVAAAIKRLQAAGYPVTGTPTVRPTYAFVLTQDPDGNWVELVSMDVGERG